MYNGMDPAGYDPRLKRVPVIVSVSDDGRMQPLYFKYLGTTYHIDRLASSFPECPPYLHYSCEMTQGNELHRVELIYNTNDHTWLLDLGKCS